MQASEGFANTEQKGRSEVRNVRLAYAASRGIARALPRVMPGGLPYTQAMNSRQPSPPRKRIGSVALGITAFSALLACTGCGPLDETTTPAQKPAPVSEFVAEEVPAADLPAGNRARVLSITDGDTIETSLGTVRIIGIDAPERGECGADEAAATLKRLIPDNSEALLTLPSGQNDEDRYGRLLRYVTNARGIDVGLTLLEAGQAVARYDSNDGYPAHPKQDAYRSAQLATLSPERTVITVSCASAAAQGAAEPGTPGAVVNADAQGVAEGTAEVDPWWTQYRSCTHLKKNDAGHPTGPFNVNDPAQTDIYNWFQYGTGHRGDGDGDGYACE